MERYVGIDAGKISTLAALYQNVDGKEYVDTYFLPSAFTKGYFGDDNIGPNTVIIRFGEEGEKQALKVGSDAVNLGYSSKMETSKISMEHCVYAMSILSMLAEDGDVLHVGITMTADEWKDALIRQEFKNRVVPLGRHTVYMRTDSEDMNVVKKTFTIADCYAYPEGQGGIICGAYLGMPVDENTVTGVIDIGGVNNGNLYFKGLTYIPEKSITDTYGGEKMLSGLASELGNRFHSPCDRNIVLSTLLKKGDDRCLISHRNTDSVKQESRECICEYMTDYAEKIKRCCDRKDWPFEFMNIVIEGQGGRLLFDEFRQVIGEHIIRIPCAKYANAFGALSLLCARRDMLGKEIPLVDRDGKNLVEMEDM